MGTHRTARRTAFGVVAHATVAVALVLATAAPALAAKPGGGGGGGGGGGTSTPTGNDLSYPQCGSRFPSGAAFGIVGVNGGVANDLNPCLGSSSSYTGSELYWAVASTTGRTALPKASLYVNTGDPGNTFNGTVIADWPTSSSSADPYGSCGTTTVTISSTAYSVGDASQACAWQYGFDKAGQDASWLTNTADAIDGQHAPVTVSDTPGSYPWWLDVETANTWQGGGSGQAMNVADLQGMIAALQASGVTSVGAYSTSSQWDQITGGTTSASGSLWMIPTWLPGARSLSGAEANCTQTSFTGATGITVTQWVARPDGDYAC